MKVGDIEVGIKDEKEENNVEKTKALVLYVTQNKENGRKITWVYLFSVFYSILLGVSVW